jgi:hypothetical protein
LIENKKASLRKYECYYGFLMALKTKWEKSGKMLINRIHCDYEKGEMAAIQDVFGKNKQYGCLFHYIKAALLYLRKNCPLIFKAYTREKINKGPFWKWV